MSTEKLVEYLREDMVELRTEIKKLRSKLTALEIRTVIIASTIVGGANLLTKYF